VDSAVRTLRLHTACIAHMSTFHKYTKRSAVRTVVPDRLSSHEAHVAAPGDHLHEQLCTGSAAWGAGGAHTGARQQATAAGRARPRPCAEGDSARSSSAGYLNVLPSWNVTSRACGAEYW
jgi:hypothetical protein